jgi:ATP-dependent DNA helicase RecG
VLCGTHALIQSDVVFADAGLFVVDEQHRFGVEQRASLGKKGNDAHLLVMSATPIPRTLSLVLYGDLDISRLNELPPGRTPVRTMVAGEEKRAGMLGFLQKQVDEGGQAYVVCPLIEENEDGGKKAATAYTQALQRALPRCRIGLMHGKLKAAEKAAVMEQFSAGALDILVSTTVVEVGVDVPNASVMVIENAEQFGLSQLHQLRGRVGRGTRQSWCVLMRGGGGEVAKERLDILCRTTDGFLIAEEDLKLRGPGGFLSREQHGIVRFAVADLAKDAAVFSAAREAAEALVSEDPSLEEYPLLRHSIDRLLDRTAVAGALN